MDEAELNAEEERGTAGTAAAAEDADTGAKTGADAPNAEDDKEGGSVPKSAVLTEVAADEEAARPKEPPALLEPMAEAEERRD